MNALPTKLNLSKRGIDISSICPMCDNEVKTIAHSLVFCDNARQVWNRWDECPVNLRAVPLDISDIAMEFLSKGTSQDLETFFGVA